MLKKSNYWLKRSYIAAAKHILYKKVLFHALTPLEKENIVKILPKARVYMVPQGPSVQMEAFLHEQDNYSETSAYPVRFLFVGRLDIYHKGLDILVDAFAYAMRHSNGAMTLVGPDWNGSMSILNELSTKLGVGDCVNIPGTMTGSSLAQVFRQKQIVDIQVSRYEGLPSSVTEALLFGKPAILTRKTGLPSYSEISCLPHISVVSPKGHDIAEAIVKATGHVKDLQLLANQFRSQIRGFFCLETGRALANISAVGPRELACRIWRFAFWVPTGYSITAPIPPLRSV